MARARVPRRLMAAVGVGMLAWSSLVQGQDAARDARDTEAILFQIPAEPLPAALERYSVAAGRSLLYDSDSLKDRVSVQLDGWFTADAALRQLIAGTGLRAEYTSPKSLMLVAEGHGARPSSEEAMPGRPPAPRKRRYYALLQTKLESAICRDAAIVPGQYRVGLRLWVGPEGALRQLELLGSTGDSRRDAHLVAALSGVKLDEPPPPEIAQPMAVVILPRPTSQTGDCGALETTR